MSFDILVLPDIFKKLPVGVKDNIKTALNDLNNPFPGSGKSDKKEMAHRCFVWVTIMYPRFVALLPSYIP
ncbi:MAG: hypothetical protein ACXQTE_04265 [Methanosarcinaceae archaeon]